MTDIVKRFKMAFVTIVLGATVVGSYSVFTMTSARAQSNGASGVTHFKSIGPLKLNANETALIGVLLPAVQSIAQNAHLELFDSSGKMLADAQVMMGDGSVRNTFLHVEFADGSVRFLDNAGNVLATAPRSDGVVTGILLPAVQHNGNTVEPLAASVQIYGADGNRGQFAQFGDGSVRF